MMLPSGVIFGVTVKPNTAFLNVVLVAPLEVASWYAEKLGFDQGLVGDLFKSIATERYDENSIQDVKKEVDDFLKLHNL